MKRVYFISALLLISASVFAQNSGRGFNYQAVIRGTDGLLKQNENINIRFSLFTNEAGAANWVEEHAATTDEQGVVLLRVGKGIKKSAATGITNFSDLDFENQGRWLKVELQEGSDWKEISFSEIASVPFAESARAVKFPAGTIVAFGGDATKVPAGWKLCDGAILERTAYPDLYAAIGTAWGTTGATNFIIPDLRGVFLRGVSGTVSSTADPDKDSRTTLKQNGNTGNNVGSYQTDAIRNITGEFMSFARDYTTNHTGPFSIRARWSSAVSSGAGDAWGTYVTFDASKALPTGRTGGDNRPANMYVNYIIKL